MTLAATNLAARRRRVWRRCRQKTTMPRTTQPAVRPRQLSPTPRDLVHQSGLDGTAPLFRHMRTPRCRNKSGIKRGPKNLTDEMALGQSTKALGYDESRWTNQQRASKVSNGMIRSTINNALPLSLSRSPALHVARFSLQPPRWCSSADKGGLYGVAGVGTDESCSPTSEVLIIARPDSSPQDPARLCHC